ncbi:MAG: division/cell wall cluster transcriptional repressor MraZ [Tissierellia bacterium]|nr:division/cell wall cluster transcriptional repressor MraZ [Tissierellia bacterium]
MLIGEFRHSLDAKGRIIIPSKIRESLGQSFVMTKGLEGCISIYTLEQWDKIREKLDNLPFGSRESRAAQRFFYSNAVPCEYDKQGRLLIPQNLREYAGLESEVQITGVSRRLELWNPERWDQYIEESVEDPEALFESLEHVF